MVDVIVQQDGRELNVISVRLLFVSSLKLINKVCISVQSYMYINVYNIVVFFMAFVRFLMKI